MQYVKSKPLNVLDRIELNDDLVQGMPQDAYRDISELVVKENADFVVEYVVY